jgi:chromosome segregation ATPase
MESEIKTILEDIQARFTPLEEQIQRMDNRFTPLEETVKNIQTRLIPLEGIEERMDAGFKRVNEKIEKLALSTAKGFEEVHTKIQEFKYDIGETLDTILNNQDTQFKDLRNRYDGLSNRTDYVQDQVTELKTKVAA